MDPFSGMIAREHTRVEATSNHSFPAPRAAERARGRGALGIVRAGVAGPRRQRGVGADAGRLVRELGQRAAAVLAVDAAAKRRVPLRRGARDERHELHVGDDVDEGQLRAAGLELVLRHEPQVDGRRRRVKGQARARAGRRRRAVPLKGPRAREARVGGDQPPRHLRVAQQDELDEPVRASKRPRARGHDSEALGRDESAEAAVDVGRGKLLVGPRPREPDERLDRLDARLPERRRRDAARAGAVRGRARLRVERRRVATRPNRRRERVHDVAPGVGPQR